MKNTPLAHSAAAAAAAAAAKLLQSCPTLCDLIDGSPPGSPIPGFSRQEHWSGLPLPSPVHESEKWKWSCSVVSDFLRPHGLQLTRLLYPWDFPGKSTGVVCHCLLQAHSEYTINTCCCSSCWLGNYWVLKFLICIYYFLGVFLNWFFKKHCKLNIFSWKGVKFLIDVWCLRT